MAKVTNPLGSSEARGRVGGLVYNTWRGLRTVKTHTDPAHEDDPLRQAHKTIVQEAGQNWQTLSDAERADWEHYANEHPEIDWTGKPKRISGYHWYVRVQTRLVDLGLSYIDTPPTDPCAYNVGVLDFFWFSPSMRIIWTQPPTGPCDDYYTDIWITDPLSAGRNPTIHDAHRLVIKDPCVKIHNIAGATAGTYTVFARLIRSNGLVSPWLSHRATRPP